MGLLDGQTAESYYSGDTGGYRYISLQDIVNNFMVGYVGDGKLIHDAKRTDVIFHAKRGIQEFSYDISRVEKIQEIEVGGSLSIDMPQDYVGIVNLAWIDAYGVEHQLYEGRMTSKPSSVPLQDEDYAYLTDEDGNLLEGESLQNERFKGLDPKRISGYYSDGDYFVNNDYDNERTVSVGGRYGLDPELSQINGWYFVDEANGKISFSSNISGKIVILKYVSDGLGTDAEMKVHKFAEEAIYMHVAYAILNARVNVPEYQVNRFRDRRRATMRNAKIRLMNLNPQELVQTMRGKSKRIK